MMPATRHGGWSDGAEGGGSTADVNRRPVQDAFCGLACAAGCIFLGLSPRSPSLSRATCSHLLQAAGTSTPLMVCAAPPAPSLDPGLQAGGKADAERGDPWGHRLLWGSGRLGPLPTGHTAGASLLWWGRGKQQRRFRPRQRQAAGEGAASGTEAAAHLRPGGGVDREMLLRGQGQGECVVTGWRAGRQAGTWQYGVLGEGVAAEAPSTTLHHPPTNATPSHPQPACPQPLPPSARPLPSCCCCFCRSAQSNAPAPTTVETSGAAGGSP